MDGSSAEVASLISGSLVPAIGRSRQALRSSAHARRRSLAARGLPGPSAPIRATGGAAVLQPFTAAAIAAIAATASAGDCRTGILKRTARSRRGGIMRSRHKRQGRAVAGQRHLDCLAVEQRQPMPASI
jgi:hypothetical protein